MSVGGRVQPILGFAMPETVKPGYNQSHLRSIKYIDAGDSDHPTEVPWGHSNAKSRQRTVQRKVDAVKSLLFLQDVFRHFKDFTQAYRNV